MVCVNRSALRALHRPKDWLATAIAPGPRVAKPERGQHMKAEAFQAPVMDVIRISTSSGAAFAYSTKTSKYRSSLKYAGVQQFVFHVSAFARGSSPPDPHREMRLEDICTDISCRSASGCYRDRIVFFDIFPVIAFAVGQAEDPFLEDGILAVPERERENTGFGDCPDACQSVFAPTIGLANGPARA